MLVLPCVWRLICTVSRSLTRTHILMKNLLGLAQIHSASPKFTQIHSVSLRFAQSHSDAPNLNQIEGSLRSARSHPDSFRFLEPNTDLLRLMQFHLDSTDSPNFTQSHSESFIPYISFRSLQSHSSSHRFTQSRSRFSLPVTASFRFSRIHSI